MQTSRTHNKVDTSSGLGVSCSRADHHQYIPGAGPHLLKSKTPALSFEELGEMRHRHVEVLLLFKCQIKKERMFCGRCEEGEKLDQNIWEISGSGRIKVET